MNQIEIGIISLSENTRKAYQKDLKEFLNYFNKYYPNISDSDILKYISEKDIIEYINYLKSKYKNTTINRKISALNKYFNLYIATEKINRNPLTQLKYYTKVRLATTYSVVQQLTINDIKKVVKNENKITLLILLMVNSGLRVSEALSIKNKDIKEIKEKYVRIRIIGKRQKERYIVVKKSLINKIRKFYTNSDSEYLLHTKSGNMINRIYAYKMIVKEFGKHRIKMHPHMLRHFFATYKIVNEKKSIKAVSRYLGHSTTAITNDMYVDTELKLNEVNIL